MNTYSVEAAMKNISKDKIRETLISARNFLKSHNWGKGALYKKNDDTFCAMGAVYATIWGPETLKADMGVGLSTGVLPLKVVEDQALYRSIQRYLSEVTFVHSITSYNDRAATTKEDVIDTFNKAIDKVE